MGVWVNISSEASNAYTFNLASLGVILPYHRLSARVRATNVMGTVEAQSDGVLIVPVGPSPGSVWRGPDCSNSTNLLRCGTFDDTSLLRFEAMPANIGAAYTQGVWFASGGSIVPLPLIFKALSNVALNAFKLDAGSRLQSVVNTVPGRRYTLSFLATQFDPLFGGEVLVDGTLENRVSATNVTLFPLANFVAVVDSHVYFSDETWMVCMLPAFLTNH